MYKYFYIIMLIGAILLGIVTLLNDVFGKRYTKIWRNIIISLAVITVVSLIGFVVTLM